MSRMLGRYELLEQLGEGGMGAVFLARLTGAAGFEKLCIVKTVLPSIAKDADFVSRFLHEGRVLTQLSHGNIAQVLDLNEAEGTLFLALEYVAGVDLSRLHEAVRQANELMPLDVAVALVAQAADGLGAAHRKAALDGSPLNIVHRDVSPHNIMVSYEGEVKVIDFGIARSEARSRHTAQASVLGKLGYMAPEQARGEAVDHRADQYALAIVAWELLSNHSWVKRGTLTEMVVAMATAKVQPLAPLRPDLPPSLEAVVLQALSPNPDERFATTDLFAQALMTELMKLGAPPTKPALGQYVRSRCAHDFANQRQLLTRVSTQRHPGPEPARTPKVDLFAETAVRSGPPVSSGATGFPTVEARPAVPPETLTTAQPATQTMTAPTTLDEAVAAAPQPRPPAITPLDRPAPVVAQPPLNTGELKLATPSRMPLLLGGAVVLVVALGAAVFFTSKDTTPAPALPLPRGGEGRGEGKPPPTPEPTPEPVAQPTPVPVVEPDAGLEAPPPPPTEQDLGTLKFKLTKKGTTWVVTNLSRSNWVVCRLTFPGKLTIDLGTVPGGGSVDFPSKRLKRDREAERLDGQARLDCQKKFGIVPVTGVDE